MINPNGVTGEAHSLSITVPDGYKLITQYPFVNISGDATVTCTDSSIRTDDDGNPYARVFLYNPNADSKTVSVSVQMYCIRTA